MICSCILKTKDDRLIIGRKLWILNTVLFSINIFYLKLTHPRIVYLLQRIVPNGPQKNNSLYSPGPIGSQQLYADHLAVAHQNIMENLVEVVDHKTDMGIGDLLHLPFRVHPSSTGRSVDLLGVPLKYL